MKVKNKKTGEILDLQLQQYSIGLYLCLYKNNRLYFQTGLNTTREQFLKELRETDNTGLEIIE